MKQNYEFALAGNPNAGKTTMFNTLTGGRQRVGNYPGVTVEKREGSMRFGSNDLNIVDLPGTYSLTAYTQEELVSRTYLVDSRPGCVINIVDATNLERNLYLTVQLLELGSPIVVALNMMDEVRKQGRHIDANLLSRHLRAPAIETVARTGEGKEDMISAAIRMSCERQGALTPLVITYGPDLDPVIDQLATMIEDLKIFDGRFPSRWLAIKYLEGDEQILDIVAKAGEKTEAIKKLAAKTAKHCKNTLGIYPESLIADYRYGFIASILKDGVMTDDSAIDRVILSDRIDALLTNRLFGPVIMLLVLYAMFEITFKLGAAPMGWLESFFAWLGDTVASIMPDGDIESLVVSGIIGGVGGVLGFVPLIIIMFMMVTFLEDSGYMARMAYMMDRVLRIFGLHGSSVMPLIIAGGIPGGCAVPGVMASRILRSPKEKLATLLVVPFMNCGAKVPVFILICGAFFGEHAALAMFGATITSWIFALLAARFLRSTLIRGEATPFLMELPPYRLPTFKGLIIHTWERAWQYIKKAGTVILCISVIIWAAMTYPGLDDGQNTSFETKKSEIQIKINSAVGDEEKAGFEKMLAEVSAEESMSTLRASYAGMLGQALEPVSKLAGFDWRVNIALIGGFAAKEVIVSSLGTAYSMGDVDAENAEGLGKRLASDPGWNVAVALALMIFVMLYSPCFVTVVAIAKEASRKWAAFSMFFNTAVAFVFSVAVYNIGMWLFV